MQALASLRPLPLIGRIVMWVGIVLFLGVGLFSNSPAWAETAACTGNSTTGNSTIPITPITLFLKYGGPASTYQVSLCEDPDPGTQVVITTTVAPAGKVVLTPISVTLTSTMSQTISVTVAPNHPIDEPFTVVITHSASSEDPDFNYGSVNMPNVTAYYSPPIATDDITSTLHGQSIMIDVLDNDIDASGQGLTLTASAIVTQPAGGIASVGVTQTIQYTPTAGFSGIDTFTYRVEDGIGNTDVATVTVNVAAAGVENPQIEEIDPTTGEEVVFETPSGNVVIDVPPLVGVPPGSTVLLTFGEVITPTGNVDAPPGGVGTFSGLAFSIELFVNGEPVQPGQLSEPVVVSFPLPAGFLEGLGGSQIIVAVWNGTAWVTQGIVMGSLLETTSPNQPNETVLQFTTTVFGEFGIFVVDVLFMPFLERTQ